MKENKESKELKDARESIENLYRKYEGLYFNAIAEESDRGAVLISAAFLEEILKDALLSKLKTSDKNPDPLFDGGNAPIGTFSAKIELAYRIGVINLECRNTLNIFRKLRNDFAHNTYAGSLNADSVKDRMMACINSYPELVE